MEILGFQENISHSSSSKLLKSKTCINLLLSNINNATPNNSNILCSIPLTSDQFSVITYFNTNNVKSY
jgi:CRISPR/Cas system-associated protein endoribonuclease Cas2